jgi:hypothetical protein
MDEHVEPAAKDRCNSLPPTFHCCSNRSSGIDTSTIGRWNHNIFRRDTSSPRGSTLSRRSSSGSRTVPLPNCQSRPDQERDHDPQYPVDAFRSYFPGQKVIPTRPSSDPEAKTGICSGWVKDVFFIHTCQGRCQLVGPYRINSGVSISETEMAPDLCWKGSNTSHLAGDLDRPARHRAESQMVLDLRPSCPLISPAFVIRVAAS